MHNPPMTMEEARTLDSTVKEHTDAGCTRCHLGIQKMPEGYALMLDADQMYYYWLAADGTEGLICWDKWWVYGSANKHAGMVEK